MTKTTTHLLAVNTRDREGEIARAKAAKIFIEQERVA